jgi:hypothetical protein
MKLDWIVFCVSTVAVASGCRMAVTNNYPVCDSEASAVRMHAAADFDCPMSEISVRPKDEDQKKYVASGCGKSVTYYCPRNDDYGRCQREGTIDRQPVYVGEDDATAATPKTVAVADDADAQLRASMKLVLASIPYKDCGAGSAGKVRITFDESGNATAVAIVSGNYDAATTTCLVQRFRGVHAPPSTTGGRVIEWGIHLEGDAATKGSWDS